MVLGGTDVTEATGRPPFGRWLKRQIDGLGLNQAEFARAHDIHPAVLSQWITGARTPNAETAGRLARVLSLDVEVVLAALGYLKDAPDETPARARARGIFNRVEWTDERADAFAAVAATWGVPDPRGPRRRRP